MNDLEPNWFPLFKNNDNIEEGISEEFVEILKKCHHPHIICIYGDARIGKSTKMNQIINGTLNNNYFNLKKPFKTLTEIHTTMTKGCNFYGPIKIEDIAQCNNIDKNEIKKEILKDELFFVDTEGLKTIDHTTKSCVSGILTILQISSIKILYIQNLANDKFEDIVKNSKLSNILNLFNNENKIIVLIRDVQLNEKKKDERRINQELDHQRMVIEDKINNYIQNLEANINVICHILPSYELASNQIEPFPECYKEQMRDLVYSILTNIKEKADLNGLKLIDIIKEFFDIFKKVKDIEQMKNTEDAINVILSELFKEKINIVYKDICNKIDNFDLTVINLGSNIDKINEYFIQKIQSQLQNTWNFFNKLIKKDINQQIEMFNGKIQGIIKSKIENEKLKLIKDVVEMKNINNYENIVNYLKKLHFREKNKKEEINKMMDQKIKLFTDKNKQILNYLNLTDKNYLINTITEIKEYLQPLINNIIVTKPFWNDYLKNKILDIQRNLANPYKNDLLKKGIKEISFALENNLDSLRKKIETYIAEKNILIYNVQDYRREIEDLFKKIKEELTLQKKYLQLEIDKNVLEEEKRRMKSIPNGTYFIYALHCQNKVLDICGCSSDDNAKLQLYDLNKTDAQKFEILYNGSKKYYTIKCVGSKKYIRVNDFNYINQSSENNSSNQHWHIISKGNNYEILSELNLYNLEVEESGTQNGTNIRVSPDKQGLNQQFRFEIPPPPPPPPPSPQQPSQPQPQPTPVYFPIPNFHHPYSDRNSIVDALKSIGEDSSRQRRIIIGQKNNIPGQPLSPSYNTTMLNLLKSGKLIKP